MLWALILYLSGGTYSLKSTSNDRFLMAVLFTLKFFVKNLLKGNRGRNTFCILFLCLAWFSNSGFMTNKLTHYLRARYSSTEMGNIRCGYIYSYIIDHYNPSVRIIDLVFHTIYFVCVNFIHKWRDLQFKVDFAKLFMAILFTLRVFA